MSRDGSQFRDDDRERVILVHGLGGWPGLMRPLARSLEREGFQAYCWGYASVRRPIHHSASLLKQLLLEQLHETEQPVHVLTHSMGGILARAVVSSLRPTGKLLMLAPPHRGSPVARYLGRCLGRICRPLTELSDAPSSFVNGLPTPPEDLSVGIIAALRDRVIPPGNTQMDGVSEHVTVNAGHTSMLFHSAVANLAANFLKDGRFNSRANAVEASSEKPIPVV